MRRVLVCATALSVAACALPPKIEILNAGRTPISVGLDYHSRTVASGSAFVALYSGKDFTITEDNCLFRYAGLKRAGEPALRLTWSGAGNLKAGATFLAPVSRRCAIEPERP